MAIIRPRNRIIEPKRIRFTKEGLESLKKEQEALLAKRPDAVKELKRAREMGDLSENGLYKAARMNLSSIDANLRRMARMVKVADVYVAPVGAIGIGSTVLVEQNGNQIEYQVVGDYEASPKDKKISSNSPIGHAIFGKRTGDEVNITTPGGLQTIKIIKLQ